MKAKLNEQRAPMISRGVWCAPWDGPNGEIILVAVSSAGRRLEERLVSVAEDYLEVAETMLDRLDALDPDVRSKLRLIVAGQGPR